MKSLVGYTGFVGSNIAAKGYFNRLYNTTNISEAFGTSPDLLIYAGISAEKYLANKEPEKDYNTIKEAFENIRRINPKRLVLISTIDVYKNPVEVNEDDSIEIENLHPYGLNRYYLEKMVEDSEFDELIIRLPGLYGKNIKKNFIYDLINIIPSMLTKEKFEELCSKDNHIKAFYLKQDNGFYKFNKVSSEQRLKAKQYFIDIGFSAINFTDSRGSFQFYNLEFLWEHIQIALKHNIKKLNLATEPIKISGLYKMIKGTEFVNEINQIVPKYDFKTKYAEIFGGGRGYIFNKEYIMSDIKQFVKEQESCE
ncbi:NAD-dependent epimerase/dehydratase family protein [Desulfitobacterium sp. LBE]|uniref:NAD-dependent epimerase/dehydratase family protein n=1 Tax=Desulfitobacterium sp. LBE TaxID=884086 RepID=UPI00119A2EB4|nr:NAD-dependent epimerase/dehydratase family protein [Desulfitobacterium sp. LBE]TWH59731.1 NAD-dependent epimerase/dehydratase family protein [Desulfitobacterium sp. LBE]